MSNTEIKILTSSGTFAPGEHVLYGVVLTPDGTNAATLTVQDSTDGTSGTLFVLRSTGTASVVWTLQGGRRCKNAVYGVLTGTAQASAEIG
jgi:hypothetical protein